MKMSSRLRMEVGSMTEGELVEFHTMKSYKPYINKDGLVLLKMEAEVLPNTHYQLIDPGDKHQPSCEAFIYHQQDLIDEGLTEWYKAKSNAVLTFMTQLMDD